MQAYGISDIGKVRQNNEDSFCISSLVDGLYIVADGMGGHNAGEVASNLAIRLVEEYISIHIDDDNSLNEILSCALRRANDEIYNMSRHNLDMSGMGTTLTLSLIRAEDLYFSHVGDSRGYILSGGNLKQITTDHTLVEELYQSGSISEEDVKTHPQKNIITNAIGTEIISKSDIELTDKSIVDKILLCTDGLSNYLTNDEIEDVMKMNDEPKKICEILVETANDRGGDDNITVIVVDLK